mgnify:CR=1 FL=1
MDVKVKHIYAVLCSLGATIFGGMDAMLAILLMFIVLDFISGMICAWVEKKVSSKVLYVGGIKKLGILIIVALAAQLDHIIGSNTAILRTAAITYYIANEGFSILENWGNLGLPLPKAIKNALISINKDED